MSAASLPLCSLVRDPVLQFPEGIFVQVQERGLGVALEVIDL